MTENKLPLFNEAKALSTTNNDISITLKLRKLFVKDLSGQLNQAEMLWKARKLSDLQSQLHHILGGAEVCAAESLIACIKALKIELKKAYINEELVFNAWQEISAIAQQMNQAELNN